MSHGVISVTELRNALRCPRVFALGRADGRAVAFPIGASSLGALFHRIADRFARELDAPPADLAALRAGAPTEEVERAIAAWLLDHLIAELDPKSAAPASADLASMPGEIDDLAEALRQLAGHLAAEIAPATQPPASQSPAAALRALVPHAELAVEAVLEVGSPPVPVRVTGRIDALFRRPRGGTDVVEYKLTDDANEELDRAQVALYRALLRAAHAIDAEPVILRFNPGRIETRLSPLAADDLLARSVLPLLAKMLRWSEHPSEAPATARRDLCPACPVRHACAATYRDRLDARDLPPSGANRPRPEPEGALVAAAPIEAPIAPPADATGQAEADELARQLVAELRKSGVTAKAAAITVGSRLLRVEVVSPRQKVTQLDGAAKDVEHRLADRSLSFVKEGPKRVFLAPRKAPRKVELATLLAKEAAYLRERPGRYVLGERIDGAVLTGDLSDGSACHLLVGGQTGSGKSVLLRVIVSSLCQYHPPAAIRFTLVDPKRVTFGAFAAGVSAHLTGPIVYDVDALLPELDDLVAEMEDRYARFDRAGVESIDAYNERLGAGEARLARRVVVVDEFQDLIAGKATRQDFLDAVKRLGAKARAAGIHLILATQRPDKSTVPGEIKANLGGKIALKVQALVNSRIILDAGGAETLLGRGDLMADLGHGVVRAQAPAA